MDELHAKCHGTARRFRTRREASLHLLRNRSALARQPRALLAMEAGFRLKT
jgi:hypothetical protein